jgi:dipeptidase
MCDTIAVLAPTSTDFHSLLAKNSDREPNEAQLLTVVPRRTHTEQRLKTTCIEVDQVRETNAVLLCRPFWMWGAEMGVNEYSVAIGNEAVFTRGGYGKTGLTGMDLLRLALERCDGARSAVDVIISLLEQYGQGATVVSPSSSSTTTASWSLTQPRPGFWRRSESSGLARKSAESERSPTS